MGVETQHRGEASEIAPGLEAAGFTTLDLPGDELAGPRSTPGRWAFCAVHYSAYRFEFPERQALMRFLDAMRPDWNISRSTTGIMVRTTAESS